MLQERITGAFTFRKGVYAEVENDAGFTSTAWLIVAVVSFLNQIGANASTNILSWLGGAVVGTIFAVAGFAVGAWVINWVGRAVFHAEVTFEEMVRTLGLAYVWNIIGFLGIFGGFIPALGCLFGPIMILAVIALIVAWFIAAKEALDLEWLQTIVTVVLGWIALMVIILIGAAILGLLGWGASQIGGFFGG
jgi:CBS domain containing-hemolysin-like protein